MPRAYRNAFNTGVLDPLLHGRMDLEQRATALKTGTNFMLLPHGGAARRPGLRYVRTLSEIGKLARFRRSQDAQYTLHFRNLFVDIHEGYNKITQIAAPWETADIPYVNAQAQTADTMVVFSAPPAATTNHTKYQPRRILRGKLRAAPAFPIRTTAASTVVRVYQLDHAALDGDAVGLSGITDVGNVTAERLNTSHTIAIVGGSLPANPVTVQSVSPTTLRVNLGADFGFEVGDFIELDGISDLLTGSQVDIPAEVMNRVHAITNVTGNFVDFEVAVTTVVNPTGRGGAVGAFRADSFYEIDIGGAAADGVDGGGNNGFAWMIPSLVPNDDRRTAFEELPRFDYRDSLSPPPQKEIQKLTFSGFLAGDRYQLVIPLPPGRETGRGSQGSGGGIRTVKLTWSGTPSNNVDEIQGQIDVNATSLDSICTVEYVDGSSPQEYLFRFTQAVDYDDIQVLTIKGEGTISQETVVEGGSRLEDVISDVRGWPAGGLFYQRRLWMWGLYGRPSTILASMIERFFEFDTGSALDDDAIDATGEFDTLRYMVAERGIFALTDGSEVLVGGGDNEAVTPSNINLQTIGRWGAGPVPPVSVGGAPTYADRTGRAIRQLGQGENGAFDSRDVSISSQHLISNPLALAVWRNLYGDYLFVVNNNGTAAVLNVNIDQGVAGWTNWTTDGLFKDAVEVGDELFVTVQRTINGQTVYYLEVFDFDFHTDSGAKGGLEDDPIIDPEAVILFSIAAADTIPGFSWLEGKQVQVRVAEETADRVFIVSGEVSPQNGGDFFRPCYRLEVGLPIPTPTLEPMPPTVDQFSSISKASIDLYESRAVCVNGWRLRDRNPGQAVVAGSTMTGLRPIQLRGWGERTTVTVTAPDPQPCLVRAIDMEVA